MFKRKQIVVIGLVVVLMGLLLSLKIKKLEKVDEGHSTGAEAPEAAPALSLETVSTAAKQQIDAKFLKIITDLEAQLQQAGGAEKLSLQKKLAQQWDDLAQSAPAAFYYEEVADNSNAFADRIKAADLYSSAYQGTKDSLSQPALVAKAFANYDKALSMQPDNVDAKLGKGIAMVNGAGAPMQGIALLLEVVKTDPKNVKANMNLGLFSIKSGQFDKAIDRFKTVLEVQQTPDVWFYLATCYENRGEKKSAIEAYEEAKKIAANKQFGDYIDQHVKELKKQ